MMGTFSPTTIVVCMTQTIPVKKKLPTLKPWLFAIEFADGTVALVRGTEIVKIVIKDERPEGWNVKSIQLN